MSETAFLKGMVLLVGVVALLVMLSTGNAMMALMGVSGMIGAIVLVVCGFRE